MIKGLGTDIIEVSRIEKAWKQHTHHFLDRLFTKKEQEYCFKHRHFLLHLAGRFAAKEAISKALGTGFGQHLGWLDIEILNDEAGKPYATLSASAAHTFNHPHLILSISHCRHYATAVAIHALLAP